MCVNNRKDGKFKKGELYHIGCKGKDKGNFLIINCSCKFLEKLKEEHCKVISYEWGIVCYKNNTMILLNKGKLKEIQQRVKNGLDIKPKEITSVNLNKDITRREQQQDKERYSDTSMADFMMQNAELDAWEWSFYE